MKTLSILLLTILLTAIAVRAQTVTGDWQRFTSSNGEFSIEMPKAPAYFYDKDGFSITPVGMTIGRFGAEADKGISLPEMQMLNAGAGNTVMSVEIYRPGDPKFTMKALAEKDRVQNAKKAKLKFDCYEGLQVTAGKLEFPTRKVTFDISFISKYIATDTHLYIVTAANRGTQSAESMRFLNSLAIIKNPSAVSAANSVSISALKPLGVNDIGTNLGTNDIEPSRTATPAPDKEKPGPVLIISKLIPSFTPDARNEKFSGDLRLRVSFSESGRVSEIRFMNIVPKGLNRNSFFAALRIKFLPAEKNGNFIPMTKVIEYGFKTF